jgi:hypothetical protein
MTAPRDPDGLLRDFLADGQDELPDRAFDAVRHDIHRTRQRAVLGPWRVPDMANLARIAIAAVVVAAAGFTLLNFGPSAGGVGATASPDPIPTVTPGPSPLAVHDGVLEPGRYALGDWPLSIAVPAGWTGSGDTGMTKDYGDLAGPAFAVGAIAGTFVDPCTDHTLATPTPTGIDDLAAALASQPGTSATTPADVTIDGHQGKVVEVTVTADVESCGPDGFWLWATPNDAGHVVQDANEVNRVYIVDVEGFRIPFYARIPERTTAADRAEVEAMLESIDIQIR